MDLRGTCGRLDLLVGGIGTGVLHVVADGRVDPLEEIWRDFKTVLSYLWEGRPALAEQVEKDQTKPVAVVRLRKDHYAHKSYGKIYTPVFEIVEWISMDADATDVKVEAEAEQPKRRRRSA